MSASREQIAALLSAARDNLLAYCCAVDPKYIPYAWHKLLCRRLEAAIRRGRGRIMVFAPPHQSH